MESKLYIAERQRLNKISEYNSSFCSLIFEKVIRLYESPMESGGHWIQAYNPSEHPKNACWIYAFNPHTHYLNLIIPNK